MSLCILSMLAADVLWDYLGRTYYKWFFTILIGDVDFIGAIEFTYVSALGLTGYASKRRWLFYGSSIVLVIALLTLAYKFAVSVSLG